MNMKPPAHPEAGSPSAIPGAVEAARLAAARRGDSHEFSLLTEPYRRELPIHCYRILGSLHEAEDLVQETFLRAWRRLETYEGRASLRAWLYKIATNACLDALDRLRTQRSLPASIYPASDPHAPIAPPFPEPVWLEPFPDEWLSEATASPESRYLSSESVSLAFLAALQVLPPRQRVVLILRDVLDLPARETAQITGLTVSAVNSALHRARVTLAKHYHGREAENLSGTQVDEQTRGLLERYVQAWETADVAGLIALLKEDATFSMPPSPSWYDGRASIGPFVAATVFAEDGMFPGKAARRWRLLPVRANAQPAFAIYQRSVEDQYLPFGIHVLTIERNLLSKIVSFIDASLPLYFGLPESLKS